jgi:RNA polymerase sigma factor (sigma-70 family)
MSMDDRQLLAALTGSHREAALAECIGRYGPMVHRTAWRITGDEHLAEDVCQAVFLVLMRQVARLQGVNLLGAWLYRVAVLTARKIVEGKVRRQRREQEAVAVAQARPQPINRLPTGIDQAINRLPTIFRQVIVAHYLEGRSYGEVAARLGVPEETAKKRGTIGLHRLRRSLAATAPGLSVAVLAGGLAGEAATASAVPLATSSVAAIQASALGTGAVHIAGMADAAVKAMAWTKLQIWGAAAAAVVVVVGGIAAFLPSKSPDWQGETRIATPIHSVAFSADGRYCATGYGFSVFLWDMHSGRKLATLPGPNEKAYPIYYAVALSPDGTTLAAVGTTSKVAQIWETDGGTPRATLNDIVPNTVTYLVFSPDGRSLAAADIQGGVHVRDIATGKSLATLPAYRTGFGIAGMAFSPDGKTMAITPPDGNAVQLWKLATGEVVASLPGGAQGGPLAFSPDGRLLAGAGSRGVLKVWDVASGKERLSLAPSQDQALFVSAVAFSRDSKRVAAFVYAAENQDCLTVWDLASGQRQASFAHGATSLCLTLAFGNDNKTLDVGGNFGVQRWTEAAGRLK